MPAGYFYSPTLWTNSPPISSISWNHRHSTKNIWLKVLDFTQDPRFLNSKFYPEGEMGRGWNDDDMSSWESKGPGSHPPWLPQKKNKKQPVDHLLFSGTILMKHHCPLLIMPFLLGSLKKHWGNIVAIGRRDVAHHINPSRPSASCWLFLKEHREPTLKSRITGAGLTSFLVR